MGRQNKEIVRVFVTDAPSRIHHRSDNPEDNKNEKSVFACLLLVIYGHDAKIYVSISLSFLYCDLKTIIFNMNLNISMI
jgi:hypothetical protein